MLKLGMRMAAGTATCCAAALSLFGIQPAAAVPLGAPVHVVKSSSAVNTNQSSNWSGYNIGAAYPQVPKGTTFRAISGVWTVPTATQHTAGQAEASATWVGIGGGCVTDNCTVTDSTLIQAGTEQNVSTTGQATYGTWWEIIPAPSVNTPLAVAPGQRVFVGIKESKPGVWRIVIKNLTTGQVFAKTVPYTSSMDTAEWIEETPLVIGGGGSGLAHMPNLGVVKFRQSTLNTANPGFRAIDEMQLSNSGQILATPSAPNSTTNGFNDCTYATTCAAP
jgi:hypothetical protein